MSTACPQQRSPAFALERRLVHGRDCGSFRAHPLHRRRGDRASTSLPACRSIRPRRGGDSIASRLDELRCGFKRPPTPMHRLDTDTSGCLLFARSPKARASFQQAFEARAVEKYYLAVVATEIAEEAGVIDLRSRSIRRAEAGWKMVSDPHGLAATTRWRRIAVRDGSTLVEFQPLTGRTHQIRAHAREAFGRGIVGDRVYGVPGRSDAAARLAPRRSARRQGDDRRHRAASRLFRRDAA